MTREINFRIPMFTDKGTFTGFQYLKLGDDIYGTLAGYNGEPEQDTGLKDKNGKEIFEGDIVKADENYQKMFEIDGVKEVQFYCGAFMMGDTIKPLSYFVRAEDTTKSFLEIIGNVYENPELIK